MEIRNKTVGLLFGLGLGALLAMTVGGCSSTIEATPEAAKALEAGAPPPPAVANFMGADASKLTKGPEGGAALVYLNPSAQWAKYSKINLLPVEFWAAEDSKVSSDDQKVLTGYFYNVLKADLSKNFTVVDQPGPDTITLRVALMDATTATPGLRSISVVVPQARILNAAQSLATDSYAFAGSAEAEMKATDSVTGDLLAAAVDERAGGLGLSAATSFKWGDAEHAMDYWAQKISDRFAQLQGKTPAKS